MVDWFSWMSSFRSEFVYSNRQWAPKNDENLWFHCVRIMSLFLIVLGKNDKSCSLIRISLRFDEFKPNKSFNKHSWMNVQCAKISLTAHCNSEKTLKILTAVICWNATKNFLRSLNLIRKRSDNRTTPAPVHPCRIFKPYSFPTIQ